MAAGTSIVGLLEERAGDTPDQVCLWFGDQGVTYSELHQRALSAAAGMSRFGVQAGDRVGIIMENRREFVECWLGTMLLGALAVPINLAYRGQFLRHQLDDSQACMVLTDGTGIAALAEVVSSCRQLKTVAVHAADPPPGTESVSYVSLNEIFGDPQAVVGVSPQSGDPATILYTSGTTGMSKGVVMSHAYLVTIGGLLCDAMKLSAADTVYLPLPLFHLGGLTALLTSLVAGSSSVIEEKFSVTATWDRIRTRGATAAIFVGPMLQMLWQLPADPSDADLPIRVLGAAPMPPGLEEAVPKRYHCDVWTMYGMTEAFPLAIANAGDPFPAGAGGRRNPTFDIRLVDDAGEDVPVGVTGEIICRPRRPHVMFDGYLDNEEATARQVRDGWFFTGDYCREDVDGFVYFVDRKKDAIRRRGENISSFELEHAIRNHPSVADVAVIGVPSPLGEEDVKAVIVAHPDHTPSFEELQAFFRSELPPFAVPRFIEFVTSIPRNPVGRILKYQLREQGITAATWDRDSGSQSEVGSR